MTKTYNFKFEDEMYKLVFNNPEDKREPLIIDPSVMQFDTQYFYEYIFQDVNEKLVLNIENQMNEKSMDGVLYKKGLRIFKVIKELGEKITEEINKQCFS